MSGTRGWRRLAGGTLITQFDPQSGGIGYILKNVEPADMDEIQIHFSSPPRKRTKLRTK